MLYVVGIIIIAVGGSIVFGVFHISHENSRGERPSLQSARMAVRRARMASGDMCVCGGQLADSAVVSQRYGALLGCSGCDRFWTPDGRRMVRRRVAQDQRRAARPARAGRK
jgi:hypothetical protein